MISVAAMVLGLASLVAAGAASAAGPSPYAGWEDRAIKALSAEQIADLRAGRGMGLALAAELNGYPGPRHVLDLADQLALSPEQRARAEASIAEMEERAVRLGERLIASEAMLERLFAEGRADPAAVRAAAVDIGRLQGELRAHHLGYHLAMRDLLSAAQIERYQVLRGYAEPRAGGGHGGHGSGRGGHD
jgi:Spy/CpxP family protein refolding chaperone